jgi:hypothetical protein
MSLESPINKRKLNLPDAPRKQKQTRNVNSDILYTTARRLNFTPIHRIGPQINNNLFEEIENEEEWTYQKKILTISNAMETNMNIIIIKKNDEKVYIKPLYFNSINNIIHLIYENLQTNVLSDMISWLNISEIKYIV